jgi:hypothetical protein
VFVITLAYKNSLASVDTDRVILTTRKALLEYPKDTAWLDRRREEPDLYCLAVVRFVLRLNSGGRKVIRSHDLKRLARLGDGVAVALIKLLNENELPNTDTVKACLTLINMAFSVPNGITAEEDKNPKVTLFLLNYLYEKVSDPQLREQIQQTIQYVRQQTSVPPSK